MSRFTADNLSRDNKYNIGSDIAFRHDFEDNSSFTLSGHYTIYDYERDQNVISNFFDDSNVFRGTSEFNTLANQGTEILTAKMDYNLPIDDTTNFSAGGKYSNTKTDSDITRVDIINGTPVVNPDNTDAFKYDEKIYAGYVNFSKTWDKWDLSLGLRVEQTNIEGRSVVLNQTNFQDYLNWFPNAGLSYQVSDDAMIYANYKRSITRPSYTDLNPFTFFLNENTVVVGNPNLIPTYQDHFIIGTTLFRLFYRRSLLYQL